MNYTKNTPVIAIVGAGSLVWGRRIAVDIMLNPDLAHAELRLVDIHPERLEMVHEWLDMAKSFTGWKHPIVSSTNLRQGLQGATAAIVAIAVGSDRLWRYDATHPQLDGIFQPVGDTTGPGGAMRALRHAPALKEIAGALADVGAPNALLLNVTNPLNALTACIDETPGIQVAGFCHGYCDTEYLIARSLGLLPPQMPQTAPWRDACEPVCVELAGNNHFVFADKIHIGEVTYDQRGIRELTPQIFDCPFREAVYWRYGAYVGNYARHPAEFLPGFINLQTQWGRAWGFEPVAKEINPLNGERLDTRYAELKQEIESARKQPGTIANWDLAHTDEPLDRIVAAFHTGKRLDMTLNLRNRGAISGVEDDCHVEMFCRMENGEIFRPEVTLPEKIVAEINRVGREQLLLSQCCQNFDEDLLVESLLMDALVPDDPVLVRRLMREMLDFQKEWTATGGRGTPVS